MTNKEAGTMTDTARPIGMKAALAYGLGDLYGGGSFFLISTFVMYYLVAIVGMNPILAGLIPGLGKVWDAISDPLMGYISDHTKAKSGRRRIWFLIGILPIFVTFSLIWLPVPFKEQWAKFAYYFVAYLGFYTISTMVMVPYSALSAEMTRDFKQRNKLTSFRMLFSILATLIAGVVAQPIISAFPGDPGMGHLAMAMVFGAIFALPWVFTFFGTWELPVSETEKSADGIFKNFASIFRNRAFLVQLAMYIMAYGAMDVMMNFFKFFILDCLGRPEGQVTIFLGSLLIAEILSIPGYLKLSNAKGHAASYKLGLAVWAVGMVGMFFQTSESPVWLLAANCVVVGLGLGAGAIIPYQLLPFVVDVDELITGKKRAGTYGGAMTLVRKLIQGALVIPLVGFILSAISYRGPLPATFLQGEGPDTLVTEVIAPLERLSAGNPRARELIDAASRVWIESDLYLPNQGSRRVLAVAPDASESDKRLAREAIETSGYGGFGASPKVHAVPQTTETKSLLRWLFLMWPVTFLVLGIAFSFAFILNRERHAVMMAEIERLRSGGSKKDVAPETKELCERISGRPYDSLFGAG
jgi:oligogalacturonide transporter